MYQLIVMLCIGALVALDQFTKYLAVQHLYLQPAVTLWDGVFEFLYSENQGIAWGLFQGSRWPVVILTAIMLSLFLVALLSGRFKLSRLVSIGGILVLAGGIGNLIDRIFCGYVVDFIHYYKWFDFPIFNVADSFITVGAVLIVVYFFFFADAHTEKGET